MKRVELRGLQVILAIVIIGCVWIMANGEALGYHHIIFCSSSLSFTATCLIKPEND